eukprot:8150579-Pyramimonas_sp.AAC.1
MLFRYSTHGALRRNSRSVDEPPPSSPLPPPSLLPSGVGFPEGKHTMSRLQCRSWCTGMKRKSRASRSSCPCVHLRTRLYARMAPA